MYDPAGVRQLDPFIARAMIRLPDVRRLDPSVDRTTGPRHIPSVTDEAPPPRPVDS